MPRLGPKTLLHETPWHRVFHVEVDFGIFKKSYYPIVHGMRSGVVVPRGDEILLVRQYRLQVEGEALEIPGGKVDSGEDPGAAAMRECFEETGVKCSSVTSLIQYIPGMDLIDNPTQVFLAEGIAAVEPFRPNDREVREVLWLPLSECLAMVFSGRILCALTIVGLLAYAQIRSAGDEGTRAD